MMQTPYILIYTHIYTYLIHAPACTHPHSSSSSVWQMGHATASLHSPERGQHYLIWESKREGEQEERDVWLKDIMMTRRL